MFGHRWFLKMGELSDSSVSALMSNASELIACNYAFHQGIDSKGQAQTNVRVSDIELTYDGLPSQEIIEWALDSATYLNGALVLYDANDIPLKKLFFQDTACVGLQLSYSSYGSSPVLTKVIIKPRRLVIDDFTINQNWTNMSDSNIPPSTGNASRLANKAFNLARPLSKYSLDLLLDGKKYEIESINLGFWQGADFKGQPQNEVRAGTINFSISGQPDNTLNQWMLKSELLKNGEFVFNRGAQNSPLKISFTEAYCVNMTNRTASSTGMLTEIKISANEVNLNERECYNYFKL